MQHDGGGRRPWRCARIGEADASRVRMMGEAQADKAARVGIAEAVAIEEQVRAYGGPRSR